MPTKVIIDKYIDILGQFATMVHQHFGTVKTVIVTRNPQANAMRKRVHGTPGNMIRLFELKKSTEENLWSNILTAVMFAI